MDDRRQRQLFSAELSGQQHRQIAAGRMLKQSLEMAHDPAHADEEQRMPQPALAPVAHDVAIDQKTAVAGEGREPRRGVTPSLPLVFPSQPQVSHRTVTEGERQPQHA